jgi:hypothetical protein
MPYNPQSIARLDEFLTQLSECGIVTSHLKQSIYTINDKKVSIRTTTKPGPVYWYDVSINVLNSVEYLIYQTDSKYNFALFPSSFLRAKYGKLKDSNRPNAKIFYIDWPNKLIASKPNYKQSIETYFYSTKENQGKWVSTFTSEKTSKEKSNHVAAEADYEHYSIDDVKAFEGYKIDRSILDSVRNQGIAKQRKILDKYTCQACWFSVTVAGNSVIECHHLYPLSETLGVETVIDDLISLCPTCHRIAHLRKPPYSPKEISEIIKNT